MHSGKGSIHHQYHKVEMRVGRGVTRVGGHYWTMEEQQGWVER